LLKKSVNPNGQNADLCAKACYEKCIKTIINYRDLVAPVPQDTIGSAGDNPLAKMLHAQAKNINSKCN